MRHVLIAPISGSTGVACLLLVLGLALGPAAAHGQAEDVVTLVPNNPADTPLKVRGTVLDYTGQSLTLQTSSGETTIPTEKVARVDTVYPPQFDQAWPLLLAGQSTEAIALLQEALAEENRPWVRRAIQARLAVAFQNAGRTAEAGSTFLAIVAEDPQTFHQEAMPLAWGSHPPNFERDRTARQWLESPTLHAHLMGASWLLSTADRTEALRVLNQLRQANQPQLALLAEAQIWQTKIVTATAAEVNQWAQRIEANGLRGPAAAGPYLVLGKARRQLDQDTQAALLLMRPPILFPELRPVAAEGLLLAARSLERTGQHEQATRLAREVVRDYGDQPARQEAEIILKRLASVGGN